MNKRLFRTIQVLLTLMIASASLAAAELDINYLEGELEYREGQNTWISLGIGDTVPETQTLRLSGRGYAELSTGTRTVTLARDGVYELDELLGNEPETTNFRQVIGSKFSALLGRGRQEDRSTVAAVRAAEAETDDFISWEDETTDYLSEGLELFEAGDFQGALEQFEEGSLWESGAVQRECAFRMGISYQKLGQLREARNILTGLNPEDDDPYLDEYTVVVGTLYLESMDYSEVDRITASYLESHPRGEAAQAAWLLSAFSLQGQGLDAESRRSADNAVKLGPNTEIGRAAAELVG